MERFFPLQIICGKRIICVCVCVHTGACTCMHSVRSNSNPMDCSLPGSSVCGILQARLLEWVAIFFSRGSSQPRDRTYVSCIQADSLLLSHQGSPRERILLERKRNRDKSQSFPVYPGVMPCPMESFCSGGSVPSCKPGTYILPCLSAIFPFYNVLSLRMRTMSCCICLFHHT